MRGRGGLFAHPFLLSERIVIVPKRRYTVRMTINDIEVTMIAAARARAAGRVNEALRLYDAVLESGHEHPVALNALGMDRLGRADPSHAATFFERAIKADPTAPELWMNLAKAQRESGDDAAERAALDGALAIDQRHFMALVRLAEWHERQDESVAATERWSQVLALAMAIDERPPAVEHLLAHARSVIARQHADVTGRVDGALAEMRAAVDVRERQRVDACMDHALGRRQIYTNQCAGIHFPFLPADEYFDRQYFPWLSQLEAATSVIRDELLRVIAEDASLLQPYVAMKPGTPQNKWSPLDGSLAWSAMHLWKDGQRDDAVCARLPQTTEIVQSLPLSDLPGRTPTVFFSILQAGAHLPAHTGVSNVRAIIHLPLIVPPGCSFRVGGDVRDWVEGEAWAFDDTIEHEAWNRSNQMRAILILDVWNPHITSTERDMLRTFFAAAGAATETPRLRVAD